MDFLESASPYIISIVSFVVGIIVSVSVTFFFRMLDLRLVKRNLRVQNEINLIYQIEAEVSSRYRLLSSDFIGLGKAEVKKIIVEMVAWSGKYPHRRLPKYSSELITQLNLLHDNRPEESINNQDREKIEGCFNNFLSEIENCKRNAEDPDIDPPF